MILIVFVFITCLVFLIAFEKRSFNQKLEMTKNINGPPPVPIFGHALRVFNKTPIEFAKVIGECIKGYGKMVRLCMGNQLLFVMADPKDVEVVLTNMNFITKSHEYQHLMPWLGTGLLTSTDQKWLSRRKIITPAFHFNILQDFVEIFDLQSSILKEKLKKFESCGEFNVIPLTEFMALDVVCETMMGFSLNSQNDPNDYVRNVNELVNIIHKRSYNLLFSNDFLFKLTKNYRRHQSLIKSLHNVTKKVIITRREQLKNESSKNEGGDLGFGGRKKLTMLDILLQSTIDGKLLSDEDIREELDTFMFEGHDTVGTTLAFTLYNLGKHPNVQQKCFEEIRNVIGEDKNAAVNMKTLNDLKYLELVIKENLRLFSPVPLIGRKVTEDIEVHGKWLPKGSSLLIAPFFMSRDPDIFKNPLDFIPERFDVETTAERVNPYAYIPFSAGSRNCIGQKFAMLEVKSTISKILRHYRVSIEKGFEPELSFELVIKSKNGLMIKLDERVY